MSNKKFKSLLEVGKPIPIVSTQQSVDGRKFTLKQLNNMVRTAGFLGNEPYIAIGHDGVFGSGQEPRYGSIDPDSLEVIDNMLYVTPIHVDTSLIEKIENGNYRHESVETTYVNYNNMEFYDQSSNLIQEKEALLRYRNPELSDWIYGDHKVYNKDGFEIPFEEAFLDYFLGFAVLGRMTPNFPQFKISEMNSYNMPILCNSDSNYSMLDRHIYLNTFNEGGNMALESLNVKDKSNVEGLSLPFDKKIELLNSEIHSLKDEIDELNLTINKKDEELNRRDNRIDNLNSELNKYSFGLYIWFFNKERGAITFEDLNPDENFDLEKAKSELNKYSGYEKSLKDIEITLNTLKNTQLFKDYSSGSDEDRERLKRDYARRENKLNNINYSEYNQKRDFSIDVNKTNDTTSMNDKIFKEAHRLKDDDMKNNRPIHRFSIYLNKAANSMKSGGNY